MCSNPLLFIQAGTPPEDIREREGDLPDWFRRALGPKADALEVIRVFEGEPLPSPGSHRAAIITGSWSMVTERLDWSEATAHWIRQAMGIGMPLFGVCYGHQLMAHALGGQVGYHPAGLEVGCQEIEVLPAAASDPLADLLPSRFAAHLTHLQTVLTPPPGAVVLARSSHDPHQIVRYGPHAISTQFHPEFTPSISAACVKRRVDMLRSEGRDPEAMLNDLRETPIPQDLLRRFVQTYVGEMEAHTTI
ncbi:GMP synthase [Cupriavidus necator]|uniref:GMP synthase n=1 Tax=Cupriavidus necator TaxID=106590 RepID=A0A1U9UW35_CUPNE|nr:glutamine amidotransferase [Cupriavidus necator]AQV96627.1 GMP synthase [Cupriavidus necator]